MASASLKRNLYKMEKMPQATQYAKLMLNAQALFQIFSENACTAFK